MLLGHNSVGNYITSIIFNFQKSGLAFVNQAIYYQIVVKNHYVGIYDQQH